MKSGARATLAAALGAVALAATQGVLAHDYGRHDGHRGYGWGHHKQPHGARHHHHRWLIRAPVMVYRPAPVYCERSVYRTPSPTIVIGVYVPPPTGG